MFAIAQASYLAGDGLDIKFIFSNKTKDDVFGHQQLESLEKNTTRFKSFHTLTRHDPEKHGEWNGLTGRVSFEMLG